MSDKQYSPGAEYQPLFDYLQDQFGVLALVSDMSEIIEIVRKMASHPPAVDDGTQVFTNTSSSGWLPSMHWPDEPPAVKGAVNWVKCSSGLPAQRIRVLVAYDNSIVLEAYIDFDGQWKFADDEWNLHDKSLITHWMPLPNLPTESPTAAGDGKEEKAFAEWLAENTEIRRGGKITLYRYCNKMNEWGNYTLDDIFEMYKNP